MKNSKLIRKQYGLSQSQMAYYLKITRSHLTMHENGKRDLPTKALVQLAEMELFLKNAKNTSLSHEKAQLEKAAEILAKHQKELEYQRMVIQRKIVLTKNVYQQNCYLLQFTEQLINKHSSLSTDDLAWLNMIKKIATSNIEKNGLHHQLQLNLKMQMHLLHDQSNFI